MDDLIRIPVDLNNVRRDLTLAASLRRATGIPSVGDVVRLVDQNDDPHFYAFGVVTRRDSANAVIVSVHWDFPVEPSQLIR